MDTTTHDANLILASRVQGTKVYNSEGEDIGRIEDLSIEKVSGRVLYGLISFGGFLGLGDHLHPVPWSLLTYHVARNGYVVPLAKEKLTEAPHYSPQQLEAFGGHDTTYRADVHGFYGTWGAVPYWT